MSEPSRPPYVARPPINPYAIIAAIFAFAILPPLGIYFGNKAKQQITQTGERGIELANVGVIAGWVLTLLFGLYAIVACVYVITAVMASR